MQMNEFDHRILALRKQQRERPGKGLRIPFQSFQASIYSGLSFYCLKRLGHAILGNFSMDQVVIELTEIAK